MNSQQDSYQQLKDKIAILQRRLAAQDELKKKLVESEARFRLLAENARDMIYRQSLPDGKYEYVSPGCLDLLGYTPEEIMNSPMHIRKVVHPDWRDYVERNWKKLKSGIVEPYYEYQIIHKNGAVKLLHQKNSLIRDEHGKPIAIEGVIIDITRHKNIQENLEAKVDRQTKKVRSIDRKLKQQIQTRKSTEQELKYTTNLLHSIFESVTEYAIIATDNLFNVILANPTAYSLLDFRSGELIGRNVEEIHSERLVRLDRYNRAINEIQQKGKYEFSVISPDSKGNRRFIHAVVMTLRDAADTAIGYILFARDITRIKNMQSHLIQAQNLATTGKMAISIAHEINSPLQGIIAMIGLIKRFSDSDAKLRHYVELVEEGIFRICKIVQNLLDLNRPASFGKQPVDIHETIRNTLNLLKVHLENKNIDLELHLAPGQSFIYGSAQQISSLIMNLVNNAIDAIQSDANSSQRNLIRITTENAPDEIILRVEDSGSGIPEADMNYIFDPFFTTKNGTGVGIGLSICHNIVAEHNGTIHVNNSELGGAAFKIVFPYTRTEK